MKRAALDFLNHPRIQQGGDVAEIGGLAFRHLAQDSPHDLSRTGFRKAGNKLDLIRLGYGTNYF